MTQSKSDAVINLQANSKILTALFNEANDAEIAYQFLIQKGYSSKQISLIMSEATRTKILPATLQTKILENDSINDIEKGTTIGASIGLTVGAFVGPLLAVGLMLILANDIRTIFWIATIPAALAVLVIIIGVRDVDAPAATPVRVPLKLADLRSLPKPYWAVVALGAVLTLARFSEAFLILKANAEGLPLALTPLVLVVMNLVYAAGAYPAGHFADRVPPVRLLGAGVICLIAADLVLAMASGLVGVTIGLILWGAHMALTQGLLAKLVADHAPAHLRGSAFGMFNLATGIALLFASVIAGLLWDRFGADATFFAGAGFAAVALLLASRYPKAAQSEPA